MKTKNKGRQKKHSEENWNMWWSRDFHPSSVLHWSIPTLPNTFAILFLFFPYLCIKAQRSIGKLQHVEMLLCQIEKVNRVVGNFKSIVQSSLSLFWPLQLLGLPRQNLRGWSLKSRQSWTKYGCCSIKRWSSSGKKGQKTEKFYCHQWM